MAQSDKNDVLESLQDARDAIKSIAEDIGEGQRVGIVQDALSAADTEIVRLERELADEKGRRQRWQKLADQRAIEVADLRTAGVSSRPDRYSVTLDHSEVIFTFPSDEEAKAFYARSAGVGSDLAPAVLDLLYAARRVWKKYGHDEVGIEIDWTEWTDLRDAINAIDPSAPSHERDPEQHHSGGVAESQAPSIREGDAGVAPGHPPVAPVSHAVEPEGLRPCECRFDASGGIVDECGYHLRARVAAIEKTLALCKRAGIFYKAAFYDRNAHIHLDRRYTTDNYVGVNERGLLGVNTPSTRNA